jgi:hypothetical protein
MTAAWRMSGWLMSAAFDLLRLDLHAAGIDDVVGAPDQHDAAVFGQIVRCRRFATSDPRKRCFVRSGSFQ